MKVQSTYAIGLILLIGLPVFGQSIIGMSSRSGMQNGVMSGSATFRVAPFSPPPVAGAPYSGEEVREDFQTLVDGTHITHQMPAGQKTWRDSQGRVRTERGMMGGNPNRQGAPSFAQISDPVAGYLYVLDDVSHVAHRVKAGANNQRPAAMAQSEGQAGQTGQIMTGAYGGVIGGIIAGSVPAEGGGGGGGGFGGGGAMTRANRQRPEVTAEDLGSKMIDGVLVFGTRRTTIIPEGMQGNDRPMTTTSETWRSKELQLTVLDTSYSPLNGTNTTRIANLSISEPDPALFMVPADYAVVDETGNSFTIDWTGK
jgi:hypothetical protein